MYDDYPKFSDEALSPEFRDLWFYEDDLQLSCDSSDGLENWKGIGTEYKDKNIPYSDSNNMN